jgi:hypothetical protein
MNGKKLKITVLILAFCLLCSNAAFAWNMACDSELSSGIINIGGYSVTSTDIVCDEVEAYSELYRNYTLVDYDFVLNYDATWAQTEVSVGNPLGIQHFAIYGDHRSKDGQAEYNDSSYSMRDI